jgi:hypothetical protein
MCLQVPPNYDSLLGKLIVWGEDRTQVCVAGWGEVGLQQSCFESPAMAQQPGSTMGRWQASLSMQ